MPMPRLTILHDHSTSSAPHARRTAAAIGGNLCPRPCAARMSTDGMLSPASPFAVDVANLGWAMLAGGTVVLTLVTALAILATLRPSALSRLTDSRLILGGGIVLPVIGILALSAGAARTGATMHHRVSPDTPTLRIEAVARQWEWRFHYADHPRDAVMTGHLRLPEHTDIEIVMTSEDVTHSFWVPELGGKMDATPGHRSTIRLHAGAPGHHLGLCAEFCGIGHTAMPFTVEIMPTADFDLWLRTAYQEGARHARF